jgi:hypothetical protein
MSARERLRQTLAATLRHAGIRPAARTVDAVLPLLEEQHNQIQTLRAGESDQPAHDNTWPTPAEWIHRWNRATREQRLAWAAAVLDAQLGVMRCFELDHDGAVAEEAQAKARISAALAFHLADTSRPHGPWCPTCLTAWPCATYRALIPCPTRTAEEEQRG